MRIPLFALLFSLVIGALIILFIGYSPISSFSAIFGLSLSTKAGITLSLSQATPLLFTGLAFAIAYRVRMINTGAEGQLYAGAMAAALIGAYVAPGYSILHVTMSFLAAAFAGGLVALLVAFLKVRFEANEIILCLMLNEIVKLFTAYLANSPLRPPGSAIAQTKPIEVTARLTRLIPQSQVTTAILLGVFIAIMMWFIQNKTVFGFDMLATGLNVTASKTAGIGVAKIYLKTFFLSGAIAGIGGAAMVLGIHYRFIEGFSPNYGFAGISIAALANYNPLFVPLSALLFGVLKSGAMNLNRTTPIPIEIVDVIQVVVIIFVAAPRMVNSIITFFMRAPHTITAKLFSKKGD